MEKRGKRCYGLSATRATSTERHTAQEKRRAPSWRGCRPVNSGKSFSAARRWFHPASSRLLLAWCSEYPPGHPHTGCNMGHVAAKNIICPPPFAQAHNAHQDIRNMPTAQIPFLAPSLSLSLSLSLSSSITLSRTLWSYLDDVGIGVNAGRRDLGDFSCRDLRRLR